MSGLAQRAVTAFFFVLIVVGGTYWHPYAFGLVFLVVTIISLWEFFTILLTDFPQNNTRRLLGVSIGALPYIGLLFQKLDFVSFSHNLLLPVAAGMVVLFLAFIYELFANSKRPYYNLGVLFTGVIYLGIPFALLLDIGITTTSFRPNIIFGMLWLTWTNDTAAYIIGSQIGKTKLFPRISPKKTWEGSIAGVLFTMLMGYGLSTVFTDLSANTWIVVAALVAIFGSLGDLVESMLKRSMHIKDSGTLLPGHGGFLDRFDAFIFLIPFVYLALLVLT